MELMSPYRSPTTASRGTASSRAARSSSVSVTSAAPTFSSRYFTRLVPGIGATPLVVALREHPRERELAGRAALVVGDRADPVDELEVGASPSPWKRGKYAERRESLLERGLRRDRAGQDAAAER